MVKVGHAGIANSLTQAGFERPNPRHQHISAANASLFRRPTSLASALSQPFNAHGAGIVERFSPNHFSRTGPALGFRDFPGNLAAPSRYAKNALPYRGQTPATPKHLVTRRHRLSV
jgi:hypothetical protein